MIFFNEKKIEKDSDNFWLRKLTLKVRNCHFSITWFRAEVDLTKNLFYEKIPFFTQSTSHLMRKLLKKSKMLSTNYGPSQWFNQNIFPQNAKLFIHFKGSYLDLGLFFCIKNIKSKHHASIVRAHEHHTNPIKWPASRPAGQETLSCCFCLFIYCNMKRAYSV